MVELETSGLCYYYGVRLDRFLYLSPLSSLLPPLSYKQIPVFMNNIIITFFGHINKLGSSFVYYPVFKSS